MSPIGDEEPAVEEILARVPLFSRLGGRDFKKLGRLCVPRAFAAGDTVIEEGAVGLGMFVLVSGAVEVFKGSGDERVVLGRMTAGEVLGEIALIDDQPRSASAVAVEATECLLLTKDSFDLLVRKEPEIAWCIVPSLADRVRELHAKAIAAEEKLRLLEEADASSGSGAAASGDEECDDDESSWAEPVTRMVRLQYGLMKGGVKAMTGMADAAEEFMSTLGEETHMVESGNPGTVAERLPDGLVSAFRASWSKMEEVPQEVLDSLRQAIDNEDG